MTEATARNESKRSLLMRLKPESVDDKALAPKSNDIDPVLSYIAIANKNGAVLPAILSSLFGGGAPEDRGHQCGGRRRRKATWQALGAVIKGTTWMRKVMSRRKAKKAISKSTSNMEEASVKTRNPGRISLPSCSTSANSSPLAIASSSQSSSPVHSDHASSTSTHETYSTPPSIQLNNGTGATKQKQCGVEERKKVHENSTTALYCMFAIILFVLILWGRFPAILCTSVLLYVVRPSPRKACNEGGLCGESGLDDSVQNRNRRIKERKLQRSRSHVYLSSHGSRSKLALGGKSFNLRFVG
uniref:Uncharacterized protein n=2 Tax=Cajanus cajan TaxID=3821 RepID=A0A151SVJ3_CAJCA|nr:hypothetical protein KK1_014245 [Cajanus cajan]